MILKIQRPTVSTGKEKYLIYNKDKSVLSQSLEVGEVKEIDEMFNENEYKIYAKGYIDKKGNLVINRKVEDQNW